MICSPAIRSAAGGSAGTPALLYLESFVTLTVMVTVSPGVAVAASAHWMSRGLHVGAPQPTSVSSAQYSGATLSAALQLKGCAFAVSAPLITSPTAVKMNASGTARRALVSDFIASFSSRCRTGFGAEGRLGYG